MSIPCWTSVYKNYCGCNRKTGHCHQVSYLVMAIQTSQLQIDGHRKDMIKVMSKS